MRFPTANGYIALGSPSVTLHNSSEPIDSVEIDAIKLRAACWEAFALGTTQHFQDGFYEVAVRWGGIIVRDVITGAFVRTDSFDNSLKLAQAIGKARCFAVAVEGISQ